MAQSQQRASASEPPTGGFSATDLAVAGDRSAFALAGTANTIYKLTAGTAWSAEGGTYTSISVASDGSVWAVDSSSGAFARYQESWESLATPSGATLAHVSAGSQWNVLGWTTSGDLWIYDVSSNTWHPGNMPVRALCATADGSAWGLTTKGQPMRFLGDEQRWEEITGPEELFLIGAATEGWVWAVGASSKIWRYDAGLEPPWVAVTPTVPGVPGACLAISCGEDLIVWVLTVDSSSVIRIYSYDLASESWTEMPALPLGDVYHDISVAGSGSAWCTGGKSSYRYTGEDNSWAPIPTNVTLTQLAAVSGTALWGLVGNQVYRSADGGKSWTADPHAPALLSIAAAADATVIGATTQHGIVRYEAASSSWGSLAAPFQASVVAAASATSLLALSATGVPYRYEAGTWAQQSGSLTFADIAAASDGSTWAVDGNGHVFQQFDVDEWFETALQAKAVAVGAASYVWLILPDGTPEQITAGVPLTLEGHVRGEGSIRPRWATDDPFDESRSTHLWILRRAAILAQGQGEAGKQIYALVSPKDGRQSGTTFHNNLYQGLYDADYKAPYNNPALFGLLPTYKSHFLDADSLRNYLLQKSPTTLTEGLKYFEAAVRCYQQRDLPGAGYNLGLATHYFTDTTQPMHASNFPNGVSAPWPMYHSDMENGVLEYQSSVTPPSDYVAAIESEPRQHFLDAATRAKSYYNALGLDLAFGGYAGFWGPWPSLVRSVTPALLTDAVRATSQFLVRWMQATQAIQALAVTADKTDLRQMCCLDALGNLWHQIWPLGGTPTGWRSVASVVAPDVGPKAAIGCATNAAQQLYVLAILPTGTTVSYAVREINQSWQSGWTRITSQFPSQVRGLASVVCAFDGQQQLQALTLDSSGMLWHTVRSTQGTWQTAWGSVGSMESNDFGAKSVVACAGDPQGLHVLAIAKRDGTLWYTFRQQSGSWQPAWLALNSVLGPNLHGLRDASLALDGTGTLHVTAVDGNGVLWYARRTAGAWGGTWARVDQLTAGTRRQALARAAAAANLYVLGVDENLHAAWIAQRAGGAQGAWQQGWVAVGQPPY